MRKIVIVNHFKDWEVEMEDVEVVTAKAYLTDPTFTDIRNARVFNLCRSYKYQSSGYYVSLLAEARGHRIFPSVTTIQDLKSQTIVRAMTEELSELIQKSLGHIRSKKITLSIYFGQNLSIKYEKLSKQLHSLFQAPFLKAHFVFKEEWELKSVSPISCTEIPDRHRRSVSLFAKNYFSRNRFLNPPINKFIYDVAILVDPNEKDPPSDKKAIQNFMEAAESLGFYAELITKDDYRRLLEFDALFIRETTAVNHHTYRFARRAHADGLVVIDDPVSILRCTNKVYLAELLMKNKIPVPKTMIIHQENRGQVKETLGLPCVLKKPDSAFSVGVVKVETEQELEDELNIMFQASDLIIGQEFKPTDFDWRIGILDRQPLYACKYFMAKNHWQIYNWEGKKSDTSGHVETLPFEDVPFEVLHTAMKAANLIGDGLYGVDVKEMDGKAFVIEVNDNPSIDSGWEDKVLKKELYRTILRSIKTRLDQYRVSA
jgi:glutathione synthase/RimK-type ligase-like ATP-grasp enzyme